MGDDGVGQLIRVSIQREYGGRSIGQTLVEHLLDLARHRGLKRIWLETSIDWHDTIGLHRRCGFIEYHRDAVAVYMALDLG